MDGFNNLIDALAVGDIGFKGHKFTWSNNRTGIDRIAERLDRALSNTEWNRLFPNTQCIHGLAIGSDHVPISVRLNHADSRSMRAFKFEDMWLQKPGCLEVIKSAWERGGRGKEVAA